MEEYASAKLLALVQQALAAEGIRVVAPVSGGAQLPLAEKRRFLTEVAHDHGLLPLLRVGALMPRAPSDPAVAALLGAVDPHDLVERWRRLERFTHSRHRVVVRERGTGHLVVEHAGPPGAPPDPAEDALVLGVLTALLPLCGARDLTVTVGGADPVTVFSHGAFTAPPPRTASGLWRFTWSRSRATASRGARAAERDGQHTEHTQHTERIEPTEHTEDEAARARRLLTADPARRWTLGALAVELGVPTRSLQRRLSGAGGFSGLLGTVRTELAAELLMRGEHTVSVIGFACGYADQPHFTRHFKLRTAMTPAVYRSVFQRPTPGRAAHPDQEPKQRRTP
ncbi:helix-turn-helix transcriptional regulator [Streptomyces sp. NPDC057638]|uniref:helix-turn-helix transcriptional regulator n=1 Tax=Streptomyces sp. NPDC057638 TaxID=3346190 RepID=UPI0036792DF5